MSMVGMGSRRTTPLSRDEIIAAAIELLDAGGEAALTARTLAARLRTGAGAIYWHLADKEALLVAAADGVVAQALAGIDGGATPAAGIRALAAGVFDAIDAHPWVGAQLARTPWQAAMLGITEGIGGRLAAMGVPDAALLDAAATLVGYLLGVAGQNAANARLLPGIDRDAFLADVAARWTVQDPARFPFLHRVAARFATHDDRAQFLAGIDLILAGIDRTAQ